MNDDAHRYLRFYTFLLLFIVLAFVILYQAKILLIPMSFGVLISFILYPVCLRLEKYAGRVGGIFATELILIAFAFGLFQLLANSITLLQQEFTVSKDKIFQLAEILIQYLGRLFVIDAAQQKALLEQLYDNLLKEIFPFIKQTIFLSAGTLTMLLIIPVFVALILYYRELLVKFTLAVVPNEQVESFKASFREIAGTYFKFAKGMAMVYLVVAVLNSLGFLAIGLPNAVYFGVLASLLTFFPYFGIFLGGLAAIIVAWTTYNAVWYPIAVVAILSVVQYLEANVIFPVLVGHQLRINPFITFVAVILGGIVWGGAGMILFVPFAAVLKILADRIESLRPLSLLLSDTSSSKRKGRKRGFG
jgi:predicted PurR-regulated permease PerM